MRSLAFALVLPLMATAAFAQTPTATTPSGQSGKTTQTPAQQQALRQQVKKNLQQAGFTDIKIVPSSFLVQAKDKQGNQVMMTISPNSITAVTEVPNATTGQGSSTNQGSQSTSPQSSPSQK